VRRRAAQIAAALAALALAGAAGCAQESLATRGRPAAAADLECSVEGLGLQPEGGLPAQLKLSVRNKSADAVAFTLPRPLIDEQTVWQVKDPLVLLAVSLKDKAGHEEAAVYSHPKDKAPARAQAAVIPAGGTWTGTYPLSEFYFWGPCGPDTGGAFTRYFWRGEAELALRAALVFEKEKAHVESPPISIRCKFEEWLFQKKRSE